MTYSGWRWMLPYNQGGPGFYLPLSGGTMTGGVDCADSALFLRWRDGAQAEVYIHVDAQGVLYFDRPNDVQNHTRLLFDDNGIQLTDASGSARLTRTDLADLTDSGATTLHKHDHGDMDGLADDDHALYHTDGRADTWLGTKDSDDVAEGASNRYLTAAQETALTGGGNADAQHVHDLSATTGDLDDVADGASYKRLSAAHHTDLTDSGDCTIHYHKDPSGQITNLAFAHQRTVTQNGYLRGPDRISDNNWLGFVLPRSGSITAVTVYCGVAPSGSAHNFRVFKNGVYLSGAQASVSAGSQSATATFSTGTYTFAAGDALRGAAWQNALNTPAQHAGMLVEVTYD